MVTSVQFEETTSLVAWRQRPSSTNNMLCGQISCYSNCELDYKANIPFVLSRFFGDSCPKCKHSLRDHRCYHAQWVKVTDVEVSVEQDMKTKWEDAKDVEERRVVFTAACGKALNDLNHVMNRATDNLRERVGRHESLALGGSFAAQVRSAVKLLKQRYEALKKKEDVSPDQLEKVQKSVDCMEKRLAVLETAEKDTQNATIRIGS